VKQLKLTREQIRSLEIAVMFGGLSGYEELQQMLVCRYHRRLAMKRAWYAGLSAKEKQRRSREAWAKLKSDPARHAMDKARRRKQWAASTGARRAARYSALSSEAKLARSRKAAARAKANPAIYEAAKKRACERGKRAYAADPEKYRKAQRARSKRKSSKKERQ
jgi:hypothetical protein